MYSWRKSPGINRHVRPCNLYINYKLRPLPKLHRRSSGDAWARPLMRCFFLCYLTSSKNSFSNAHPYCFRESGCKDKHFRRNSQEILELFLFARAYFSCLLTFSPYAIVTSNAINIERHLRRTIALTLLYIGVNCAKTTDGHIYGNKCKNI